MLLLYGDIFLLIFLTLINQHECSTYKRTLIHPKVSANKQDDHTKHFASTQTTGRCPLTLFAKNAIVFL